jgi:hypothetical protein
MRKRYKEEKEKLKESYIDKRIENKSDFQKFKSKSLKRVVVVVNVLES